MKLMMVLIGCLVPICGAAQDRDFTLSAPVEIVDTGFLQYLLPRFSLKHGVRITQIPDGGDAVIGAEGVVIFSGLDALWYLDHDGGAGPMLFAEWLASDIGKRTIDRFEVDGTAMFSSEVSIETAPVEIIIDADPVAGEALSLTHCGRCHVINERNRMGGMGQTPSFALMRTFEDWQNRFSTFYVLNPHPSFSQVEDITLPFPAHLPPSIVPLEITQDELDAIVAYVATIPPADLGTSLQRQ